MSINWHLHVVSQQPMREAKLLLCCHELSLGHGWEKLKPWSTGCFNIFQWLLHQFGQNRIKGKDISEIALPKALLRLGAFPRNPNQVKMTNSHRVNDQQLLFDQAVGLRHRPLVWASLEQHVRSSRITAHGFIHHEQCPWKLFSVSA